MPPRSRSPVRSTRYGQGSSKGRRLEDEGSPGIGEPLPGDREREAGIQRNDRPFGHRRHTENADTPPPMGPRFANGTPRELSPDEREEIIDEIREELGIPNRFPRAVATELADLPDQLVPEAWPAHTTDLRHLPLVTIDGETAKDFDDAVAVIEGADHALTLWVAIADVASYVPLGGPLDTEARRRGTSVYWPGQVIPMLPHALSSGLCSLKPNEDRLVLAAEIKLSPEGQALAAPRFHTGVMRSRARLTYTAVQAWLDGAPEGHYPEVVRDPALDFAELVAHLKRMEALARVLKAHRKSEGGLEIDLPEAEVDLSPEGAMIGFSRRPRLFAHELIEQFMVLANEAVAEFLAHRNVPVPYRVHESPNPEKMGRFLTVAARFGVEIPLAAWKGKKIGQLADRITAHPAKALLFPLLLRSLKQARYDPENVGHFGLASGYYLHFTSPIRRYPDLVTHRQLKAVLRGIKRKWPYNAHELGPLCEEASLRERDAMRFEREVDRLYACLWMRPRVGERFVGTITGVEPFGCFVTLDDWPVDGLVPVENLGTDYYVYDPETVALAARRSGRAFRLGDRLDIRVESVDLGRRRVRFAEPRILGTSNGGARGHTPSDTSRSSDTLTWREADS